MLSTAQKDLPQRTLSSSNNPFIPNANAGSENGPAFLIGEYFSNALHVLDCFHIVGHLNKAVDNVRRAELKKR